MTSSDWGAAFWMATVQMGSLTTGRIKSLKLSMGRSTGGFLHVIKENDVSLLNE